MSIDAIFIVVHRSTGSGRLSGLLAAGGWLGAGAGFGALASTGLLGSLLGWVGGTGLAAGALAASFFSGSFLLPLITTITMIRATTAKAPETIRPTLLFFCGSSPSPLLPPRRPAVRDSDRALSRRDRK